LQTRGHHIRNKPQEPPNHPTKPLGTLVRPTGIPTTTAALAAPSANLLAAAGLGAPPLQPLSAAAANAAAAPSATAGPGGRGAGPDHREARLTEGMAAMINALRPLPLVARTWDLAAYTAHGMRPAARPAATGLIGREIGLQANHFGVQLKAPKAFEHAVAITPPGGSSEGSSSSSSGVEGAQLPPRLVRHLVAALAAQQGWAEGWVCDGARLRVYATQSLVDGGEAEAAAASTAVIDLSEDGEALASGWGVGKYEIGVSLLGTVDLSPTKQPAPEGSATAAAAPVAAPQITGQLSRDAVRIIETVLRQALVGNGGGTPASVAAAHAEATASAAVAAAAAAAAPPAATASPPVTSSDGTTGAPSTAPSAPALGSGDGSSGSGSIAGAPAAAATAPPAAFNIDTPCIVDDADGSVFLWVPHSAECHAQLGAGVEAWLGFCNRVEQTQGGLSLVLDLESRAFVRPGPLPAVAEALLGAAACAAVAAGSDGSSAAAAAAREGGDEMEGDRQLLHAVFLGMQVEVALPGSSAPIRRTIRSLSAAPAAATPLGADGSSETVGAHYESALGRQLRHPAMPCVDVGVGVGAAQWVPAELCT